MRILFLSQWFQPEPIFKGLAFAKALEAYGHEVEVLTGFPNYPGGKVYPGYKVRLWQREVLDGVRVTRAPLYPSHDNSALRRILNYCSFAISSTLFALTLKRPDVVYVYSPPMTAAAAAVALRLFRGVPFVIDVQDLWPDTLTATGMVREGPILRMVGAWTNFVFRRAAHIVVLSPGFKERLTQRHIDRPISVIPNWAPPEIVAIGATTSPTARPDERFEVLFAGNMGKAQNLDVVIAAAERLRTEFPAARFTLVGGGVERERLEAAAAAARPKNVRFLPPCHPRDMPALFAQADALLVHLRDDPLFAITIPSKTQAYLVAGKPILMGVRGDAAALLQESGAGIAFTPEDPDAMVTAIKALAAKTPAERAAMGAAGAAYYRENLSFEQGVAAFEHILSKVVRTTGR